LSAAERFRNQRCPSHASREPRRSAPAKGSGVPRGEARAAAPQRGSSSRLRPQVLGVGRGGDASGTQSAGSVGWASSVGQSGSGAGGRAAIPPVPLLRTGGSVQGGEGAAASGWAADLQPRPELGAGAGFRAQTRRGEAFAPAAWVLAALRSRSALLELRGGCDRLGPSSESLPAPVAGLGSPPELPGLRERHSPLAAAGVSAEGQAPSCSLAVLCDAVPGAGCGWWQCHRRPRSCERGWSPDLAPAGAAACPPARAGAGSATGAGAQRCSDQHVPKPMGQPRHCRERPYGIAGCSDTEPVLRVPVASPAVVTPSRCRGSLWHRRLW